MTIQQIWSYKIYEAWEPEDDLHSYGERSGEQGEKGRESANELLRAGESWRGEVKDMTSDHAEWISFIAQGCKSEQR